MSWYKESYRHYLAGKGISLNRYNAIKLDKEYKKYPDMHAFTLKGNTEDIFISNMPKYTPEKTAEVISHEELHNILARDVGDEASDKLDKIHTDELEIDLKKANLENEIYDTAQEFKFVKNKRQSMNLNENSSEDDLFKEKFYLKKEVVLSMKLDALESRYKDLKRGNR